MEDAIIIKYKWSNEDKYGDLVCELTEFFDKYILLLSHAPQAGISVAS